MTQKYIYLRLVATGGLKVLSLRNVRKTLYQHQDLFWWNPLSVEPTNTEQKVITLSLTVCGGAWVLKENLEEIVEDKPQVMPASSVPPVTVKREVLTIDKIGVGQTFIVHGKPEEVYVKISNSHVFNHKRLQMHTTDAQRFTQHLNLVVVELVVYNGK